MTLYKFTTIVGFGLIVVSFIPMYMAYELESTWLEAEAYVETIDNYFNLKLMLLNTYRTFNDSILESQGVDIAVIYPEDLLNEAIQHDIDSLIIEDTGVRMRTSLDDSMYELFFMKYMTMADVIRWWGIGLSLTGIVLWFFREQRYRDRILRNEAKGAKASQ